METKSTFSEPVDVMKAASSCANSVLDTLNLI